MLKILHNINLLFHIYLLLIYDQPIILFQIIISILYNIYIYKLLLGISYSDIVNFYETDWNLLNKKSCSLILVLGSAVTNLNVSNITEYKFIQNVLNNSNL